MMNGRFTIFVFLIFVGFTSCNHREEARSEFQSEKWLQVAFRKNLPPLNGEIQGTGDTEESFNCFFRFEAESNLIEPFLLENGFKESNILEGELEFDLPLGMRKHFNPKWQPHIGKDSKLFVRQFEDTSTTEVLLESKKGKVYVHTKGDSSRNATKMLPAVFCGWNEEKER